MTFLVAPEHEALEHAVRRRLAALLRVAGVEDHELRCEVRGTDRDLVVELTGPAACEAIGHAVRVRVLDAVHAAGRTFGEVTVETHFG
jgi:hypothetical protein